MSTIFGLLLLLATVVSWTFLDRELYKLLSDTRITEFSKPIAMMLAILLLALPNWVLFRVLDRIYRRIHPAAYESSWYLVSDSDLNFTIVQAVICSLRSSALCVTVLNVSFGLALMPLVLLLLDVGVVGLQTGYRLWLIITAELLMFGLLGWWAG